MKRKIVAITATTLLVIPNFSKPVQANPAALPILGACSNPATCIVVGTIAIGTFVYVLLKSSDGKLYKGKKVNSLHSSTVHIEGNGSKPYPVGEEITIGDYVLDQEQCNKKAQEYTAQGYGQWEALPIIDSGHEVNENLDTAVGQNNPVYKKLYICQIRRVS